VVQYYALKQLAPECEMLLTMVACAGAYGMGGSPAGAQPIVRAECKAAFAAGANLLQTSLPLQMVPPDRATLPALDRTLDRFRLLAPPLQRRVLAACAAAINVDKKVRTEEAELFRAIAAAIDCPVPPLFSTPEPVAPVTAG
jgi:hypothetical protein